MVQMLSDSRRANLAATIIFESFGAYRSRFESISQRAKLRFEHQDWLGMREDAAERLALRRQMVDIAVAQLRSLLAERLHDKFVWVSMKAVYSGFLADLDDWELAETFFNSVTRRIFSTVGVDAQIEFVHTDFAMPPRAATFSIYRSYDPAPTLTALVAAIVADYGFKSGFANIKRDTRLAATEIETHIKIESGHSGPIGLERIEMLKSVFYRGKAAYLLGRIISNTRVIPLALALLNTPQGIVIDAALLKEDDVSILFSFTYSYFHVLAKRPYDLVQFLHSIIPRKRLGELYIAVGFHKHGKTELYRYLLQRLAETEACLDVAPGKRGMVMAVFTMPGLDFVFKIIKDRFDPPKNTSREAILAKYRLVFKHDRVGRLIDAQTFEHLKLQRRHFSAELLEDLQRTAAKTVRVEGDDVIIEHAYIERRVIPLDIYLRQASEEQAKAAVIDYGQAIKDLAVSNIFPGDLLVKNFGVTRHDRVVFYDYDELSLLTDCNFRKLPQPQTHEQEMAAEPWYYVAEADVFPEEFLPFLGIPKALKSVFVAKQGDLLSPDFWQQTQARIMAGEIISILPYDRSRQLQLDLSS